MTEQEMIEYLKSTRLYEEHEDLLKLIKNLKEDLGISYKFLQILI